MGDEGETSVSINLKKFQATVISIEDSAEEFFNEHNKIILFSKRLCPPGLEEICMCHKLRKALKESICTGDTLCITSPGRSLTQKFLITKVGSVVYDTLSELGHCTIRFSVDEEEVDISPGELLVKGKPEKIFVRDVITIWSGDKNE